MSASGTLADAEMNASMRKIWTREGNGKKEGRINRAKLQSQITEAPRR